MAKPPPADVREKVDWHRLFGLLLEDYFTGSPFEVEAEKDLSLHQQLLDVVIVRRKKGPFAERLADGLDDLTHHNLVTFKSFQEALDAWAVKELIGHYVNYRKHLSKRSTPLLPEGHFHLYAVCGRFPHNLSQQVPFTKRQDGVYDCTWGTDRLRVVVAAEVPDVVHNAPLHLFAASGEKFEFGRAHYRPRSAKTSSLIYQLFRGYKVEGIPMPITLDEFYRDFVDELLERLPPEKRVKLLDGLTPKQRVEGLSAADLERLAQEQRAAEASAKAPKPTSRAGQRSTKRGAK